MVVRASLSTLLFVRASAVSATSADDLCPPAADPCIVSTAVNVTDGSLIDVGTRQLVIADNGRLSVGSGLMTLRAGRLTVRSGGELRARSTEADESGGTIRVQAGAIEMAGGIDATGEPGGDIRLTSQGALTVRGAINADSRSAEESGGSITLSGATVTLAAPLLARGGREDTGGDITVETDGDLSVSSTIDASGGEGGFIELKAGLTTTGNVMLADRSALRADGMGDGGSGGELDLSAGTATNPTGSIFANGLLSAAGGDGGSITLSSLGDIVAARSGALVATGGNPHGDGGDVDLSSDEGSVTIAARIDVGSGADGDGGSIAVDAAAAVTLTSTAAAAGARHGGSVDMKSGGGPLQIGRGATIDARATGSGKGGDIALRSGGDLTIDGSLFSDGGSSGGLGGSIDLTACIVRINASGSLSSLQPSGLNLVTGRDATVVAGPVRADPSSGRNEFRFNSADRNPLYLDPGLVVPAPIEILDVSVEPCTPFDTPTPTRTGTPTRPTTPSPTATPPLPCLADCDRDHVVRVDELVVAVHIALGARPGDACPEADGDGDGLVSIDELVTAVAAALRGCGE